MLQLLLKLILAHYVSDFGLQSAAMVTGKGKHVPALPGGPGRFSWLTAHAAINAAGVYTATGCIRCTFVEFVLHTLIDYLKSEGKLSYGQDQWLHILCKLIYSWRNRK